MLILSSLLELGSMSWSLYCNAYVLFTFERERMKATDLPFNGSFPKSQLQPGLDWAKAGKQKLNPNLPHGWQESNCLSHYLLPLRCAITASWNQESSWSSRALC